VVWTFIISNVKAFCYLDPDSAKLIQMNFTVLQKYILVLFQKVMLTEEQEWSQRFAKHLEAESEDDEEEDYVLNNRMEDLGPEYKVFV
jgi:hypothetical protein